MKALFYLLALSSAGIFADRLEDVLPRYSSLPRMMQCTRTPMGIPDCVLVQVAPSVRMIPANRSAKPCAPAWACPAVLLASADLRAGAWVQAIPVAAADWNADPLRPLCPLDLVGLCNGYPAEMPAGYFCVYLDKMAAPYFTAGAAALMYAVYVLGDRPDDVNASTAAQWFFGFLGDPVAAMQLRAGVPTPFAANGVVGAPGVFFRWFQVGPGCKGYPGIAVDAATMIPWTWPTVTITDAYVFVVLP